MAPPVCSFALSTPACRRRREDSRNRSSSRRARGRRRYLDRHRAPDGTLHAAAFCPEVGDPLPAPKRARRRKKGKKRAKPAADDDAAFWDSYERNIVELPAYFYCY